MQTVVRYTAPLPLTVQLHAMGPDVYTRATCIPDGMFQDYPKVKLIGTFAELDTIGKRAFARHDDDEDYRDDDADVYNHEAVDVGDGAHGDGVYCDCDVVYVDDDDVDADDVHCYNARGCVVDDVDDDVDVDDVW